MIIYIIEFSTYNSKEAAEIFEIIEDYSVSNNFSGVLSQTRENDDYTGFCDLSPGKSS